MACGSNTRSAIHDQSFNRQRFFLLLRLKLQPDKLCSLFTLLAIGFYWRQNSKITSVVIMLWLVNLRTMTRPSIRLPPTQPRYDRSWSLANHCKHKQQPLPHTVHRPLPNNILAKSSRDQFYNRSNYRLFYRSLINWLSLWWAKSVQDTLLIFDIFFRKF